jgi:cyclophilin family peptidyl-prolyl cis-trans isomerase/protein-disulfide isomerase
MKSFLFPILIITAILLAACSKADEVSQIAEPVATAVVEGEEVVDPSDENTAPQDSPFTDAEEPCKPFSYIYSDQKLGTPYSGLPPVTEDDWVVGPDDAVVTFLEYSELQCPYCSQLEPLLIAVQELYPDDVRLVFRHRPFPESFHDKSILGAQAMEAAGKQEKFNEFKNFMFDRKTKYAEIPEHANLPDDAFWGSVAKDDFDAWLEVYIVELGLEPTQFFKDMYSTKIVDKVQAAADSANSLGINGTPTLFVNGYKWPDNEQQGVIEFSYYIQLIKNRENEYDACPPIITQSGKDYSATISTTKGDIVVDLFADIAHYAVNSFVFLAQEGWYDGLPFIAANDFALSGDPSDTGFGGPGYAYLDELSADHSFADIGKLATFSREPGKNGSTFFINKTSMEDLQGRTIFGEVTEGMDVVNALGLRENIFDPVIDRVLTVVINEN